MYPLLLLPLLLFGCASPQLAPELVPKIQQAAPVEQAPPLTPAQRVAAFAEELGISAWPRLDGCEYDRSFDGTTVGLILTIDSATTGTARWDGRCHVPLRHELAGVPPGLAPGRYVVAATLSQAERSYQFINRRLEIVGILGDVPNDAALFDAALAHICTPLTADEETDHDCRDRNRKR